MGNKNSNTAQLDPHQARAEDDPKVEPDHKLKPNHKLEPDAEPELAMNDKSAEYRAIRNCYETLTRGINPDDLTAALFSAGVISTAQKEEASNYMMSKGKRTTMLVDAVVSAVENDPNNFQKFLRILKNEAAFARIADMLHEAYRSEKPKAALKPVPAPAAGELGLDAQADIEEYLCDLSNAQWRALGIQLGLLPTTVTQLEEKKNDLGSAIVQAWLSKTDDEYVSKKGPRTYTTLVLALKKRKVDAIAQANKIQKEENV